MDAAQAQLVTPGHVEDDLFRVAEADWIVEVLFDRIEPLRKPGALLLSNTSTIPRAEELAEGYTQPEFTVLQCRVSAAAGPISVPLALHKAGALGDPELRLRPLVRPLRCRGNARSKAGRMHRFCKRTSWMHQAPARDKGTIGLDNMLSNLY
jgi:hypothetical protein|tara:strand:+ start:41766 stop:42221 length:456 start_codon:yes stop_codon:yes gene_type:complete